MTNLLRERARFERMNRAFDAMVRTPLTDNAAYQAAREQFYSAREAAPVQQTAAANHG